MSKIKDGGPGEIPAARVQVPNDAWENTIRAYGVVAACEWFGHAPDSEFTAETIKILRARSQTPRFAETYCSQCGKELGPGDSGVSHCHQHGG